MPTTYFDMLKVLAEARAKITSVTGVPPPPLNGTVRIVNGTVSGTWVPSAKTSIAFTAAQSQPTAIREIKDDDDEDGDAGESVKASEVQLPPPPVVNIVREIVGDDVANFSSIKQEFVRNLVQTNVSAEAVMRYSDAIERAVKAQAEMEKRSQNMAAVPKPSPIFFNATGARIQNASKEMEIITERSNRNMMTLMQETAATTYGSRNVTNIKVEPRDFRLDTKRVDGTKGNLRFTFTTRDIPSARIRFLTNESLEADGFDAGYSFRIGFLRLLETDEAHPIKNATRVLYFPAYPNAWSPLRFSQATMDGASYRTIASSFVPGGSFGSLNVTLVFYIANDVVPLEDGTIIRPNAFKYSVFISGWRYAYPQGRLVLMNTLTTLSNDVYYNPESGAIELDAKTGALAWDTNIVADGEPAKVDIAGFLSASSSKFNVTGDSMYLPEESWYLIAFRYPARANVLLWDPEAVINEAAAPQYTAATVVETTVVINYEYDPPADEPVQESSAAIVQVSWATLAAAMIAFLAF